MRWDLLQQVEQGADVVARLRGVPHLAVAVHEVPVAAADALPLHEAVSDQVGENPLRRPLRDADRVRNVT